MHEPQRHSVADLKDRRARCRMMLERGGPRHDYQHDGRQQGTNKYQAPRTPPGWWDTSLHQRAQ
jgi:hypothetical protein